MKRLFQPSLGKVTALCTLAAVIGVVCASGQQIFSPGALSGSASEGCPSLALFLAQPPSLGFERTPARFPA